MLFIILLFAFSGSDDCEDWNNYTITSKYSFLACDDELDQVDYSVYSGSFTIFGWSDWLQDCDKSLTVEIKSIASFSTSSAGMGQLGDWNYDSFSMDVDSARKLITDAGGSFSALEGTYSLTGSHELRYPVDMRYLSYVTDRFPSFAGGCQICN